jgi:dTDP-4-dehydrorhamnose reductase
MVRLRRRGNPVRVVEGRLTAPTATADLAAATKTPRQGEQSGAVAHVLYHFTSRGQRRIASGDPCESALRIPLMQGR